VRDLVGWAADWLNGMRSAHLSRPVVYCRGDDSVEIAATPGSTPYQVNDSFGAIIEAVATDFIVSADALVLGGQQITPQPGDRIRMPDGDKVLVYEVMDLGKDGYRQARGKSLRIHTKQVDSEG